MKNTKQIQKNPQRYQLVSDNDGHKYIIKEGDENLFYAWVQDTEEGEDSAFDFENCRMNVNRLTFTDPQGWK
jgi:hypothetical protein